jgi:hypothetical protein
MRANWEGEHILRVPRFNAAQELELRRVATTAR